MKIYNTLTRKKEDFKPIEEGKIKMYACGITVSGEAHIGHAYQSIIFDVINKYFKYKGYDIHYVRNYTDIDDKIINRANELNVDAIEYSKNIMEETDKLLLELGNSDDIEIVKVSDNIEEIINFIKLLIEKDYAYEDGMGNVYFKVDKFNDYGKLSNINTDMNYTAVRKDIIGEKENTLDFALWKSAKPGEIFFESPFGKGRPGWHIECSAMAKKYLGDQIDIHGGGNDLIFPHHENEIAQTEALTGKKFANYWVHNGMIKVNGEKMGKSLGNSITIKDVLGEYHREVIRYTLLGNSYNSDINVVDGLFEVGEKKLYGFYQILDLIDKKDYSNTDNDLTDKYIKDLIKNFEEGMDNNFNSSVVIANLHEIFSFLGIELNQKTKFNLLKIKEKIIELYNILGIFTEEPKKFIRSIKDKYLEKNNITEQYILDIIAKRNESKLNKDYAAADEFRNQLLEKGIEIKDTRDGTIWDIMPQK